MIFLPKKTIARCTFFSTILKNKILSILTLILFINTSLLACTGFYYSNGNIALAGNSEDWINPFSRIWVIPAEQNKFGGVYFGFSEGGIQGGINDQGLFYDGFATKSLKVILSKDKETYTGDLVTKVMDECRTVDEVITVFNKYNLQFMEKSMLFFGDKYGNSAIIEGDVIIRKKDSYQLTTNFYQSKESPDSITCLRYKAAKDIMSKTKKVDIDLIRRILSDTHKEGKYPTQYSNIYDLKNGKIYLYHFHNYENLIELDIEEELKKRKHTIDLPSLFPKSNAALSYKNDIQEDMDKRFAERKVIKINNDDYKKFAGVYEFDPNVMPGYTIEVSIEDNRLFVEISFLDRAEIFPESETNYFLVGTNETFEFIFMPESINNKTKLTAKMYGMEMEATKID